MTQSDFFLDSGVPNCSYLFPKQNIRRRNDPSWPPKLGYVVVHRTWMKQKVGGCIKEGKWADLTEKTGRIQLQYLQNKYLQERGRNLKYSNWKVSFWILSYLHGQHTSCSSSLLYAETTPDCYWIICSICCSGSVCLSIIIWQVPSGPLTGCPFSDI